MAIRPVIATARGWRAMYAGRSDEPQPELAHYLMNCRPWTAEVAGPIGSRMGVQAMGGVASSTILNHFTFWTSSATYVVGRLVADAGAGGAHIDTYDRIAATWTTVVAASVLNTAGVTVVNTTDVPWVEYNGSVVFTDGVNKPWMWDGTTVTPLTNAPVAYGKPTVYYGSLFFIQNSDRLTLLWSEINSPNTGYTSGTFLDTWTLSQTGGDRLVAILGTNAALYYWRGRSIGAIAGSPGANFSTTGVHDAVSGTVGCGDWRSVVRAGNDIWFMNAAARIHWFPEGGTPTDVTPFPNFKDGPETFGYAAANGLSWSLAQTTSGASIGLMGRGATFLQRPATGPGSGSSQVWFALVATTFATAPGPGIVVYDARTHLPQAYYLFPSNLGYTAMTPWLDRNGNEVLGLGMIGLNGSQSMMYGGANATAVDQVWTGAAYVNTTYNATMVDGPVHSTVDIETIIDRQDVDTYHWTDAATDDAVTFGVSCVSSQFQTSSAAPANLNQTLQPAATGFWKESHFAYGVQSIGHWFRTVITWNLWVSGATVLFGAGVKSITVTAYPEAREPALV